MGLTTENAELKIRLQALEQQAQLRDALNDKLKQEVERLKISNGEIKTPTEPFSLGARRVAYSPLASPSTLQPSLQYSPLASPSTLQPSVQYNPLASPSTLQPTIQYSPLASPSTLQPPILYSPAAPPSPSTLSYSPVASSSPRPTSNLFPLPKKSVPVLAQLPPLHGPRSSLSSRRSRPGTPQDLNEPLISLQVFNMGNRELEITKMESPRISGSETSSPIQLLPR